MALLRGSAGDWPEMGQKGPEHYKSRDSCHCLGSEIALECLFRMVGCLFYRNTLYVLFSNKEGTKEKEKMIKFLGYAL